MEEWSFVLFLACIVKEKIREGVMEWTASSCKQKQKTKPNKRPMGHIANMSINRHKIGINKKIMENVV